MIEVVLNDRLGKKVRVKCNEDDTIGDLKKLVAAQTGTRADKIRIQKWYNIYKDHITLKDYEIHDGMERLLCHCLDLVHRINEGRKKIHDMDIAAAVVPLGDRGIHTTAASSRWLTLPLSFTLSTASSAPSRKPSSHHKEGCLPCCHDEGMMRDFFFFSSHDQRHEVMTGSDANESPSLSRMLSDSPSSSLCSLRRPATSADVAYPLAPLD
ncbi:hypothetical protein ZIOFF_020580 [Zingiber officinale]|uniref:Ubiquitin-like domain-containing protein n=1 Tax=Zingiber officinale TaxID=94328 RepID=A0A8J5H6X9_ZINOF|nr:hypothetical protein ZIOFF_020580 [Zingiber officinale]